MATTTRRRKYIAPLTRVRIPLLADLEWLTGSQSWANHEETILRVLVAGDRGYIGAELVLFARAAGHEVVGLDVGWYDGCDFGDQPAGFEQRTGDIRDVTPEDVRGFDAIIHLAAISNDPIGHLNPDATYGVNAHGAVHMAKMAKAAKVPRFLFSTSCSQYGAAGDKPVDETGRHNPVTPYGASKAMAEESLAGWPTTTSALLISVTPRRTDRRPGSGPTSWSTT